MNKKTLIFLFLSTILLFTGCTQNNKNNDALDKILQRGKIIVGVKFDTKPFGYINENKQLTGFDIDLAKEISKSIFGEENKVEFKQVTPSNRILALDSGKIDMVIATMSITPQREQIVDFSIPYYMAGQAILVPKFSKITSLSDLNNKKAIVVFGSTAEKNLRLIAPEANIIGFKTYTSAYKALKEGKADAITSDDTILMGFAMNDSSVKLLPQRFTKEPYAIGFKKSETTDRLKKKINFILNEMYSSGELTRLKEKWLKY